MTGCEDSNGGCEHICTDTATSLECSCRQGYSLNSNGYTCDGMLSDSVKLNHYITMFPLHCVDINECEEEVHDCAHICINTIGSFNCGCRDGFALDSDMTSCVPGSCVAAGYSGCCMEGDCHGSLQDLTSSCFCDEACHQFNDCCDDITEINCTRNNGEYMYVYIVFLA